MIKTSMKSTVIVFAFLLLFIICHSFQWGIAEELYPEVTSSDGSAEECPEQKTQQKDEDERPSQNDSTVKTDASHDSNNVDNEGKVSDADQNRSAGSSSEPNGSGKGSDSYEESENLPDKDDSAHAGNDPVDNKQEQSEPENKPDTDKDRDTSEEATESTEKNSSGNEKKDQTKTDSDGPEKNAEQVSSENKTVSATEKKQKTEKLSVTLSNVSSYAFVNETVHATLTVRGGVAPYAINVNGKRSELSEKGKIDIRQKAKQGGKLKISVTVKDASGASAKTSCEVPISVKDKGNGSSWVRKAKNLQTKLTGDWRKDLLLIAESQIGYRESRKNFIISSEGWRRGYSVYGDLCGDPYGKWCAMFVFFCVRNSGIPRDQFPHRTGCTAWIRDLKKLGAYVEDVAQFEPQPGDLIFFNSSKKSDDADHMGIVAGFSGETIETIEGNSNSGVCRKSYQKDDPYICGYGNVDVLLKLAETAEKEGTSGNNG